MPNLSCGIVGLPNVGKSTLFNALTRKAVPAENYPFCTIDPHVGVVEVLDERLNELAKLSKSKKIVYASVAFVDIAGLVKGASKGEGLGNKFLSNIRETDALLHIVRCFENEKITHLSGKIDPIHDIEVINLELILADLQVAENSIQKLEKQAKGQKEAKIALETMKKAAEHLNQNKPIRTLTLTEEEKALLNTFSFLTAKKMVYVANVAENDLPSMENSYVEEVRKYAAKENSSVLPICAKLEEELSKLDEKESLLFLNSLGVMESGLDRLIKKGFEILDLITYLTTGEKETKAWTIKRGTTALNAAGKIHSDIEKGFIKAEVVSYEDMIKYKGRVGAREAGKAIFEGKEYIVKDGDVILFFHS